MVNVNIFGTHIVGISTEIIELIHIDPRESVAYNFELPRPGFELLLEYLVHARLQIINFFIFIKYHVSILQGLIFHLCYFANDQRLNSIFGRFEPRMLLTFLVAQYVLVHRIDKTEGSDLVLPMFTINLVYHFRVEKMTIWTMSHIVKHSGKGDCEDSLINCTFVSFLFWFMIGFVYGPCDGWIFVLLDEHGNILLREVPCSQAVLEPSIDCSWEHPK